MTPTRWATVACLAVLAASLPVGATQEATYTSEVPAGRWTAVRIVNVPKGAVLKIEVKLRGQIAVALVYGDTAVSGRKVPDDVHPLFRGTAANRMAFTVTAPATGHYYVILDNRKGSQAKTVELSIAARRGATSTKTEPRRY